MKHRYLAEPIKADLTEKMVFVGGPRQVGKTTFALHLFPKPELGYLNWDITKHRTAILKEEFPQKKMLIFDELHKYKKWRNMLKGLFDSMKAKEEEYKKILVTGSARLDYYRYGGDSLQGRYRYYRLHPFSFLEIKGKNNEDLISLLRFGGFPEPFLKQSERATNLWAQEYHQRLVHEDLASLERVEDIGSLELLAIRLPEVVGNPLSINSLREDLHLAHKTVSKWIKILERLYFVYRIYPFGGSLVKAVKKEPKLYFYNWTNIKNESFRFENLIAGHLLKYIHWLEDTEGRKLELRYARLRDKREVDFVVTENQKPIIFVEVKIGDEEINPLLKVLKGKFPQAKAWQVHLKGKKDYVSMDGIRVGPAHLLLAELV